MTGRTRDVRAPRSRVTSTIDSGARKGPADAVARPAHSCAPVATLPDLADVEEVAAWLKTTPKAVYAMVERGQLVGTIRIGRRLLFDRARLVRWLSERRVASPQESRR